MRIWWQGHSCVYSYPDQMIKDSTTSKADIGIIRPTPGCPELKAEEPWFNYCSKSQPFVQDGQKQDVSIEDSPGFLYVPYRKPANNPDASGRFEFGATFFAFLSAYNSGAQQSPDEPRFQHLKRVYWQTMLAGTFNDGLPEITDGGQTKAPEVIDYTPDGPQPVMWGATASELLSPVSNCISQEPKDAYGEQ